MAKKLDNSELKKVVSQFIEELAVTLRQASGELYDACHEYTKDVIAKKFEVYIENTKKKLNSKDREKDK